MAAGGDLSEAGPLHSETRPQRRRPFGLYAILILLGTQAALTVALASTAREQPLGADLTRRERSLLVLMAAGLANREISVRLQIALPTVKFHVTNILAKLHVENRTAAVLTALRHKLVGGV